MILFRIRFNVTIFPCQQKYKSTYVPGFKWKTSGYSRRREKTENLDTESGRKRKEEVRQKVGFYNLVNIMCFFRKAKIEKLKKGTGKHQFVDVDYMRQKEDILEKTEEAFEHGILSFCSKCQIFLGFEHFKKRRAEELNDSSSDSDLELDEYGQPLHKKKKTDQEDSKDM